LAASVTALPPDGPGVYFLIRDGQIVYVGSSVWPSRRVWSHAHCPGKNFAESVFLAVPDDQLVEAERHWIRTLRPVHNKAHNPSPDPASAGWGPHDPSTEPVRITTDMGGMIREMVARRKGYSLADYIADRLEPIVFAEYAEFLKNRPTLPSKPKPKSKPD